MADTQQLSRNPSRVTYSWSRARCLATLSTGVVAALFCALFLAPRAAVAQAPPAADSTWVAQLKNGAIHLGQLTRQTPDSVEITTVAGRLTFARTAIGRLRHVSNSALHNGEYWPADPHSSRLFFGPTGRTLPQGHGYFSDQYLFLISASVGVTDDFTIGGGTSLFTLSSPENNLYFLTPKFSIVRGDRFNVAAGALVGFAGFASGSAGLLYLVASNGSEDNAITYGAGWTYAGDRVYGGPTLLLGGTRRFAKHASFMAESYILSGSDQTYVLPILGLRFMGESLSVDLGLLSALAGGESFAGVPWLGFAIKF